MNLSTLKAQTETLCLSLEQLEQNLAAETVSFRDAEKLWDSVYRPRALSAVQNLLSYVPSRELMVVVEMGNQRLVKSDEVTCIETPLTEELASVQLDTVVGHLRRLTEYLPVEANP